MRISDWSSDVCSSDLTIRGFTEWATEGERVRQIDAILGGLNSTLERILPAVGNIAEGLFNLFGGTLGPAMEMADAITASTAGFVGWTEGKIGRASGGERVCQYV